MKIKMVTNNVSIFYWIGCIILHELYNNRKIISLVTQHFSTISQVTLLIWSIDCDWCIIKLVFVVGLGKNDVLPIITDHSNNCEKYYVYDVIHNRLQEP